MTVDRADRDRGDHDQAERAQGVALAAEPLIGARPGLRLARALGLVHGKTIERTPARRNGPEVQCPGRRRSRCDEAAAADLDDRDPRADLDQRHQHERHRPGGRADLVRDAEAADGRLEAMADRERERHPRADPQDEQAAGDPADPRKRDAVAAGADVGGEAAEDTEA